MFQALKKYFAGRSLETFEKSVERINALEPEISALSDEALKKESQELKTQIRKGEQEMDEPSIERAFALAREAAKRTSGKRPYDVQLLGGLVLHKGAVAEMSTGEGKTLAAVPPAYARALSGKGVHVVTVNEYLARRDTVWMGEIYHFLGLSVSCLVPQGAFLYDPAWKMPDGESAMLDKERDATGAFLVQQEYLRPISRRDAYFADITYGTNHEFGFDYLRDNLTYRLEDEVQRGHHFAIIDEVDSILIDEARTPLIISAPDTESSELYRTFTRVVARLSKDEDYAVDEKHRSVSITQEGIAKVEREMNVKNLYSSENLKLVRYLEECLRAKALFTRDKDYVVKDGEIIIVDEFTGRMLQGRRYTGGLHQAIEAKEGVAVKQESRTYAKISIQNYFRMYERISGMTGTAQTSAEEFHRVYNLEVLSVPTNRPPVRLNHEDKVYKNSEAKMTAIIKDVRERHDRGQPILIGTTSIQKNEAISKALQDAGIPFELLNAKNNEREGAIIAQAGRRKAITVATNMAGRGVDIILGGNPPDEEESEKVKKLGGLCVIGTERHEARRIDNQLRGRAGRQGDPGESQFYLSLDDDLLRIFNGERVKSLMERFNFPEDEPIQMGIISKSVQEAQSRVEGSNFDIRKHLLEYDDVLNKQRTAVYKKRRDIVAAIDREALANIVYDAAHEELQIALTLEGTPNEAGESIKPEDVLRNFGILRESENVPESADGTPDHNGLLSKRSLEITFDPETPRRLLGVLDMLWMNHLDDLEALTEAVGLRAYGQHDPLVEYRKEAGRYYRDFNREWNSWVFQNAFRLANISAASITSPDLQGKVITITPESMRETPSAGAISHKPLAISYQNVGRNDPCPCGAKKPDGTPIKYKHCHGK